MSAEDLRRRIEHLLDPRVNESLRVLHRRSARYAVPLDELQRELDEALGSTTLTEELRRMRGE